MRMLQNTLAVFLLFAAVVVFSQSGKMRTYTSEDWDYWEISGDATATIRTYTSEDWDYWEFSGNLSGLNDAAKMAVLFIPVFTSSIYIQGVTN